MIDQDVPLIGYSTQDTWLAKTAWIIAPSNAGKSTYCLTDSGVFDGDSVVTASIGWPKESRWTEQPYVTDVRRNVFLTIHAVAAATGRPALFNGEIFFRPRLKGFAVLPPETVFWRNRQTRTPGSYGYELDEWRQNSKWIHDTAVARNYPIFQEFEPAAVAAKEYLSDWTPPRPHPQSVNHSTIRAAPSVLRLRVKQVHPMDIPDDLKREGMRACVLVRNGDYVTNWYFLRADLPVIAAAAFLMKAAGVDQVERQLVRLLEERGPSVLQTIGAITRE